MHWERDKNAELSWLNIRATKTFPHICVPLSGTKEPKNTLNYMSQHTTINKKTQNHKINSTYIRNTRKRDEIKRRRTKLPANEPQNNTLSNWPQILRKILEQWENKLLEVKNLGFGIVIRVKQIMRFISSLAAVFK